MINIAIFASGRGSNALSIIKALEDVENVNVSLIISNKKNAGVLDIADEWHIPSFVISREEFKINSNLIKELTNQKVKLIVLAGFLWKIPSILINYCPIMNIHPALLPKYGGKGMYGHHVHQAVKLANERYSGITIHWVNEQYDEGQILFQKSCKLSPSDSPDDIASKVLQLEHTYYPLFVIQEANKII